LSRPTYLLALFASLAACAPGPPRASIVAGHVVAQPAFRAPVLVIDTASGKVIAKLTGTGFADAPPSKDGTFFHHGDGGLVAHEASTGAVRWRVFAKLPYYFGPVVSETHVFVFDNSGREHAWRGFDALTGAKAFDVACSDYAPLTAGGGQLFTFDDDGLVVRSGADGKTKYRVERDVDPPVLAASDRFYARLDDRLGVFRADNGRLERTLDVGDDALDMCAGVARGLAVTDDVVAAAGDDAVRVVDAGSGKARWATTLAGAESISVASGVAVVGAGATVVAFEVASGRKRWSATIDDDAEGVFARDGLVAVRSGDAHVVVLDLETGKRRFSHQL